MKILSFREWVSKVLKGERIRVDCPECHGDDYYCLICNGYGKVDITYTLYVQDVERVKKLLPTFVEVKEEDFPF